MPRRDANRRERFTFAGLLMEATFHFELGYPATRDEPGVGPTYDIQKVYLVLGDAQDQLHDITEIFLEVGAIDFIEDALFEEDSKRDLSARSDPDEDLDFEDDPRAA